MRDHRVFRHPTEQQKKLAELLDAGTPVKRAMLEAGYSESHAKQGWGRVPTTAKRLMLKDPRGQLIAKGRGTTAAEVEALVNGRLIDNLEKGRDMAPQSAKLLGSRKDLNMWQPESQQNTLVIVPANFDKSKLDSD
jgi:hypothetical protein